MNENQFRIQFREISIILGIIGTVLAHNLELYWMLGAFSAYLMWNAFRLLTHVWNKYRPKEPKLSKYTTGEYKLPPMSHEEAEEIAIQQHDNFMKYLDSLDKAAIEIIKKHLNDKY